MLAPQEALEVLEQRAAALSAALAEHEKNLTEQLEVYGLPRVTMLEDEYLRSMTAAELDWIRAVTDDLRSGRLNWTLEELIGFAQTTGQQALAEPSTQAAPSTPVS